MANKPTVFVVDDDPGALRSLCWLIEQADLPVRGFCSAREFLEAYEPQEPGCLVLDVRMPEITGLEVQEQLSSQGVGLPIIFITAYGDVATCRQAMKGGALDFLEKPVSDDVLLAGIRKALAQKLEHGFHVSAADYNARLGTLTHRERGIFEMLVAGKSLKEIAGSCQVTVQTVWRHRASIHRKMAVANDVELARFATQAVNQGPR